MYRDSGRSEILRNESLTTNEAVWLAGYLNGMGIDAHSVVPEPCTLSVPDEDVQRAVELGRQIIEERRG